MISLRSSCLYVVAIDIKDETATTGEDFTGHFADQVQFNPGMAILLLWN